MTKVALFEFIDEYEAFKVFIRKKSLSLDDFLIVALEPKLAAYLKAHNIPFRNTLPYFNNDSHKTILVETEKVMKHISQCFIFIDDNGLRGCYRREYAHYVRVFINHILKILEIIGNICKQYNSAELYAYVCQGVSMQPLIGAHERYCGLLLKRFAECAGLKFFNVSENYGSSMSFKKEGRRCRILEKLFFKIIVWFLKGKKVIMIPQAGGPFKKLINCTAEYEEDIVYLAIDSQENLVKIAVFNMLSFIKSHLLRKQPLRSVVNVAFFHPSIGCAEKNALFQAVDTLMDENKKSLFKFRGVQYQDIIRQKVDIAIKPHLVQMLFCSHTLRYIFERLEKSLVLSYIGIGVMAVAGELARVMKKKSLFISHGTHPVPIDSYHELELNNHCRTFMLGDYTHVALCTPVQEAHLRYFKNKYGDIDNEEIKTGPLIFTSVNDKDKALYKKHFGISLGCTVIVHAVSTKPRHGERFYFIETLDEFLSGLADIIDVVNKLDNAKLIIRIHPGFYLSDEEIKTLLPASERYIIHRKGPFSQALEAADVLISYSSTTIDESLINRIPVLLYDKWNRYNHFKTGIFENDDSEDVFPLCYVNSPDKLQPALKFMVKKIKSSSRQDVKVQRYCYSDAYRENFYSFIQKSLRGDL